MEKSGCLSLIVLGAVAIVALWANSDSFPFQSEVTLYQAFCSGGLKGGQCKTGEETANPTIFKVLVDQQIVLYWYAGNNAPNPPKRLTHCAVRNNQNWSCRLAEDDPTYLWEMVDGQIREVASDIQVTNQTFYQTSKWNWWMIRITEPTQPSTK
jgi:hypothetical protein